MRRNTLFITMLLMALSTAVAMAQELTPKGKLMYVEYTDTLETGFLFSKFRARQLADGRVEVFAFDYYAKYDSITVVGDRQPLDSIQRTINRWIEWFHPKGRRANDEHNKGRFTAIFDSGDTLLIKKLTWCWGMRDIQSLMKDYCTYQKTQMPFEEIKGAIPTETLWHDGEHFMQYKPQKGKRAKRYRAAGREFIVLRNSSTGMVTDVLIKSKPEKKYDEILETRKALLSGVYENATGQAVFGKINAKEDYRGDPGDEIEFRAEYYYDKVIVSDTIDWGHYRIQEVSVPAGAPPGWGGAGALTGPSTWTLKFTKDGLQVKEINTGMNAPTHPAFGKEFTLKKIRGPYHYCEDPWAITTEQPLTKGQLSMLSLTQLREMLEEIGKRHADGSKLSEMEALNKSLIQTIISGRRGK